MSDVRKGFWLTVRACYLAMAIAVIVGWEPSLSTVAISAFIAVSMGLGNRGED